MATIDELRDIEEKNQAELKRKKEWLKEFNWFAVIPEDGYTMVYSLDELKDQSGNWEKDFEVKVKFVRRTNKWKENLPENG